MRIIVATLLAIAAGGAVYAAEQPKLADAGQVKDPLICKREVPVGSLIATRKVCLTKQQWQKRSDDGNATARNLVEDGAGACGHEGGVCPF
jgi:hypothetical protein